MLFCNCNKSDKGQRVQYSDDPYWLDKFFSIQNNNNRQIESGWTPSLDTCSVYRIFWNFQKQYNTDLLYIWYHQFFRWYCKLGIDNSFENLKTLRTWMSLAITIAFIPYNCYLLYSNIFSFCYFRNWWEVKTLLWRSPKSFTICSASSQEIKPCSLNCSILFFSLLNNMRTDLRVTASLYDLG